MAYRAKAGKRLCELTFQDVCVFSDIAENVKTQFRYLRLNFSGFVMS